MMGLISPHQKELREAAKRALDVRETKPPSQRGMTPVGIARARDLINGVKLSPDTVKRMLNFLTRHEVDKKGSNLGRARQGLASVARMGRGCWLCLGKERSLGRWRQGTKKN
jgi:hypothetical protein